MQLRDVPACWLTCRNCGQNGQVSGYPCRCQPLQSDRSRFLSTFLVEPCSMASILRCGLV